MIRRWFLLVLILIAVPTAIEACSSDGGGNDNTTATDSGVGIPEANVAPNAWGATPCATCVRSAMCLGETTRCRAEPTCARHLDCLDACPVADSGALDTDCVDACPAPTGSAATSGLDAFNQCRTKGAGLGCKGCGTTVNALTHPLLNQVCTDPNYDAGPDATPVQEQCVKCSTATCCDSRTRCKANPECTALRTCAFDCPEGPGASACIDGCVAAHKTGVGMWSELIECSTIHCPGPCEVPPDPCLDCVHTTCANEWIDCTSDNDCYLLFHCTGNCTNDVCREQCGKDYGNGRARLDRFYLCAQQNCFACQ